MVTTPLPPWFINLFILIFYFLVNETCPNTLVGSMKTAFASISLSTSLKWLLKVSWRRSVLGATRDDFRSLEIRCIDQTSFLHGLCCKLFWFDGCCVFRPAFGCFVHRSLVEINVLCAKKLKKQEIWCKILQKMFFKFALQHWLNDRCFVPWLCSSLCHFHIFFHSRQDKSAK